MKNTKRLLSLSLVLCTLMALTTSASAEQPQPMTLAEWQGTWNSFVGYLEDEGLAQRIQELADKKGVSAEDIKAGPAKMMASEVGAMHIEGDEISFYNGFIDKNGGLLDKRAYHFVQTHTLKYGNLDFEMHEFQTAADASYPVLLMTDVHEEEGLIHFHLRYGRDVDSLIAQNEWFPTYVSPATSYDQMMAGLAHEDDELEQEDGQPAAAPASIQKNVSLANWAGAWNNMGAYLDDEPLQPAFEKLAQKEGKSVEEAKEQYAEKRRCEFDGMVFEDNGIRFLSAFADQPGALVSEGKYAYVETYPVRINDHEIEWHAFKSDDAGVKYPVILLMSVHGDEALTHFHLRYGTHAAELLAIQGWYPTFVKPNATYDQLTQEITE